jgi:hypothetical protein
VCRESDGVRSEGGWGWGENAMGQNSEEEGTVMSTAKERVWDIYIEGVEQRESTTERGGERRLEGKGCGGDGRVKKRRPTRHHNTWQQTVAHGDWSGVIRAYSLFPPTSSRAQPHPAMKIITIHLEQKIKYPRIMLLSMIQLYQRLREGLALSKQDYIRKPENTDVNKGTEGKEKRGNVRVHSHTHTHT